MANKPPAEFLQKYMSKEAKTPPASNYEDNTPFNITIDKLYDDWISTIDKIRSHTNSFGVYQMISRLGSSLDFIGLVKDLKIEQLPQESRCHAFYRYIGLPIVSSNLTDICSPGLDIIYGKCQKAITLDKKIAIYKSNFKDLFRLSDERERYAKDNLAIFANNKSLNAAVLALSSGGTQKLREFNYAFKQESTGFSIKNQSYDIDLTATVGEIYVSLLEFQNIVGETPTKLYKNRKRIISPFIVDPRIDLTVTPQSSLMAVPFVLDESNTKVSATETVQKPLIETIIKDRLSTFIDQENSGIQSLIDKIKNDSNIATDNRIINEIAQKYSSVPYQSFINNVRIIKLMMTELVKASTTIKKIQGQYYWLPTPSTSGPENGCTVKDVFFSSKMEKKLLTKKDKDILISNTRATLFNLNVLNSDSNNNVNINTASAVESNDLNNLKKLNKTRADDLSDACNALKIIEMIMGEFSGLGLCDVIAITGALYIMDIDKLLGLIDIDAYNRLLNSMPHLKISNPSRNEDIMTCLGDLQKKASQYYDLMDTIYAQIKNKGVSS